jgi:hypothetical protein
MRRPPNNEEEGHERNCLDIPGIVRGAAAAGYVQEVDDAGALL